MKIGRVISLIILGILVSFYLFPIGFAGLPESLNTKQVMAVFGLGLFGFKALVNRTLSLHKPIMISAIWAIVFSAWCYLCTTVNNTSDFAYATYIRSFAIWLLGAYTVVSLLKAFHRDVTLSLVIKYLLFVCVAQCIISQMVDHIPAFQSWVDRFIIQGETAKRVKRLYGIGASLDSAGVRFAVTLALNAYLIVNDDEIHDSRKLLTVYVFLFLMLSVMGAMVARTTLLGSAIGFAYFLYSHVRIKRSTLSVRQIRFWSIIIAVICIGTGVTAYLYQTNSDIRHSLRFAFEAFFNYLEKGEFSTGSSDFLMTMWVWPTDNDGWIYGYGHFDNWYYNTDIGYCRFTLYCGMVGMVLFSLYFIVNSYLIRTKFKDGNILALMLLAVVFIVWVKVSTDIFQFYALLLCIDALRSVEIDGDEEDLEELE